MPRHLSLRLIFTLLGAGTAALQRLRVRRHTREKSTKQHTTRFSILFKELKQKGEPRSERVAMLLDNERLIMTFLSPRGVSKTNIGTFGVNYDEVFTREAPTFMN